MCGEMNDADHSHVTGGVVDQGQGSTEVPTGNPITQGKGAISPKAARKIGSAPKAFNKAAGKAIGKRLVKAAGKTKSGMPGNKALASRKVS